MKNKLYVIIPLIAIILILSNALFGHLLYGSPYGQDINKYSIYVHLQPEWESYPASILYDITDVWTNPNSKSDVKGFDTMENTSFENYNSNELLYQNQKSFVELKHTFSDCESSWKPHLYRYAVDSIRNKIELIQGTQLNDDPYVSIYPNIPNEKYSSEKQEEIVKQGYVQFIPICTSKNSTSYDFAVSINDKNTAFDVYFVPSKIELTNYLENESFNFYTQKECSAANYSSFSGTCDNVAKNSGLLVVIPDNLKLSLTKMKINLHEKLRD
jgi:hypothetical protein